MVSEIKNLGSFILGTKISLCGLKYSTKEVVADFGAPGIIKLGSENIIIWYKTTT
jgi:hypothetical protein